MNERARVRMTDAEVLELLAGVHKLQVATLNADGTVHLVTMYYALRDGLIAFWTYRTSQKAVNLARDPRVSCLVEVGDSYDTFRGVSVIGRAELITDPDQVLAIGTEIYGRYFGAPGGPVLDYVATMAKKRVVALVHPDRVASWDHRRLATAGSL
ncbi:MAG: pyridoxamine 5'-phosphate oxidase family protein [Mycobacteriales bacterium]